jgi:hypothetical protein
MSRQNSLPKKYPLVDPTLSLLQFLVSGQSLRFDATQKAEQTFGIWDALRQNRALHLTERGMQ